MTVDLDAMMEASGGVPDLYSLLARENKIDTYSYLYEVMESSDLIFSDATGLAVKCTVEGDFDLQKFEALWYQDNLSSGLQVIIEKHGLNNSAELMAALTDAYELGKAK